MDEKKYQINLPEGCTEVVIREGKAVQLLDEAAPKKMNLQGTLSSVTDFLKKRIDKGQFEIENCHLIVDRDNVAMALVINERDERRCATVSGKLEYHTDFAILGVNQNKLWAPSELAHVLKMHRYWFEDRTEGMKLVSTLMNFTADVNAKVEKFISERGDRSEAYSQVVNSNLPNAITLRLPIFKGVTPATVEVETFANIDGKQVAFWLMSPGATEVLNDMRNYAIDTQLDVIREIAPELVIIEQ